MSVREMVEKNRSYRIFKQTPAPTRAQLEATVDVARLSASGGNLQPLAYFLSADAATNDKIFPALRWAGYLADWEGPAPQERPTGYIVILRDNEVTNNFIIDHGIAGEFIRLAAMEQGLGSCIIGSIDRPKLRETLGLSSRYEILIAIALGTPAERVVLEQVSGGNIRYWRDGHGALHVPKRGLRDILVN
jgi:nitroreductase